MATPVIKALPAAPTRSDGADDFAAKADTFVAALPPLVVQINSTSEWIGGQVAAAEGYKTAAAGSASAAADSASAANASKNAAAQSAIDATANGAAQVDLAAAQVGLAVDAKNQAQIAAAAAGAAAGLPSLVGKGRKVLRVRQDVTGVEWSGVHEIGDLLQTARNPGSLYLQAGGIYLQSAYPELFALIGLIGSDPFVSWSAPTNAAQSLRDVDYGLNNVWVAIGISGRVTRSTDDGETFTTQTPITGTPHLTAIATDRNGVWILVGESGAVYRSTDNGATWVKLTLPGVTTEKMNGIACDKNGVWLIAGDSKVYRSTDNGATWVALTGLPQTGPYLALGTDESNTFMLSRDSNSANVMRSVDRGATFVMAGSVSVYRTIAYAYDKLKDIWYAAAKEDGIFQSRNAGVTWQKTNVNKATGANISSIAYDVAVVEGAVLRVGNDVSTSAASVFLSNNDGFDYSAITSPIGFSIRAIAAKPDGTAVMVAETTGVSLAKSIKSYNYDKNTQFKLPNPAPIAGLHAYIKAKEG